MSSSSSWAKRRRAVKRRRPDPDVSMRSSAVRRPIASIGSLAPSRMRLQMSTCMIHHFNTVGLQNTLIYPNSPNVPFGANANQPRGYDEWKQLYARAMVHQFKVVIKGFCRRNIAAGTAVEADAIVLVVSPGSAASDTAWTRLTELPNSTMRIVLPFGNDAVRMQQSGVVKKMYGLQELDPSDFSVSTTGTGTPSRQIFAKLFCDAFNTTSTCDTRVQIELVQLIEFFDPKPISES